MNSRKSQAAYRESAWNCYYIAMRLGNLSDLRDSLQQSASSVQQSRIRRAAAIYLESRNAMENIGIDPFRGYFSNYLLSACEREFGGEPYSTLKYHSSGNNNMTVGFIATNTFDAMTQPLSVDGLYTLIRMISVVIYACPLGGEFDVQIRRIVVAFLSYMTRVKVSDSLEAAISTPIGRASGYHPLIERLVADGMSSPMTYDAATYIADLVGPSETYDLKFCHEVSNAFGALLSRGELEKLPSNSLAVGEYNRAAQSSMEKIGSIANAVELFKGNAERLAFGDDLREVQVSFMPLREEKYRRETIFAEFYMSFCSKLALDKKAEGRDVRLTRYQNMAFEVYRDTGNVSRLASGNGKFDGYAVLHEAEQQIQSFIRILDIGMNPVRVFASLFLPISQLVRGLFLLGDGDLELQPYSYGVAARKFLAQQRSTSYWLDIPPLQDYESQAKPKKGRKKERIKTVKDEETDDGDEDLQVAVAEEKDVESDYEDDNDKGD